jgi:arylsulfatase A-like enzyme
MYAPPEQEDVAVLVDPLPGEVGDVLSEEELDRLHRTYAGEVTLVDTWIGGLLEHLRAAGRLKDTMIVITSPCGVALGEHDWVGCECDYLYEEMLHVPLMIQMPSEQQGGSEAATMRDYAVAGVPLHRGNEVTGQWSIRTPEWHLVLSHGGDASETARELYVKPEDRWDMNNVAEEHRDTADGLEHTLRQFVDCARQDRLEDAPGLRAGQDV